MTPHRFDELRANAESDSVLISQSDVIECLDEIAKLAALVYVPGGWHCPKCKFALTMSILYAKTGSIGVSHEIPVPCPNDGTPMEPDTWERDAKQMAELMPELAKLRRHQTIVDDVCKELRTVRDLYFRALEASKEGSTFAWVFIKNVDMVAVEAAINSGEEALKAQAQGAAQLGSY